MKPRYIIIRPRRFGGKFFIIERLSGGSVSGRSTITKYNVLYPKEIDQETSRRLRFEIKGDGRSTKGTLYKKERLHEHLSGVIVDLFEGNY